MMVVSDNKRIPPARTSVGDVSGDLTVVDAGPFFNMEQPERLRKRNVKVRCSCGSEFFTREQNIIKKLSTRCMSCKNKRHSRVMSVEGTGWNVWWNRYVQNAKNRELVFTLSVEDVKRICSQNCFYCGDESVERNPARHHIIYANGIDRVDTSRGYELNNCVPCCSRCNKIKWDMSHDEFLAQVEKIYLYARNRAVGN